MIFSNKYNKILLALFCVILFYAVFGYINYLVENDFIKISEHFSTIREHQNTSHSVNMPLTTTTSCKNFCGPTARCAITGQQCFTDIDCPGCQKYIQPLSLELTKDIPGDDDAGKLTWGVTPQYSSLTKGYGTHERIVTKDLYSKPAQADFGINTWRQSYDESEKLFNKRYKPSKLQYVPDYPNRYSITGEFSSEGPLPANMYL